MTKRKNTKLILFSLIVIGGFLRFYDLNWGAPFYFHPDERNIAGAIAQLSPTQLNPHFFAYGSFPLYAIYLLGLLIQLIHGHIAQSVPFELAILAGRIFSAVYSTLLIYLTFVAGKKIRSETTGLFAAGFVALSPGLIQFAHFSTFEMWLTLGGIVFFILCLSLFQRFRLRTVLFLGLTCGLLIGVKVTSILFLPLGAMVLVILKDHGWRTKLFTTLLFTLLSAITYLLTNPYVLLDTTGFINSMHYESGVSLGTLPVFYTGEFYHVHPILFHFLHIYPFLLNPILTAIFLPAFVFLICVAVKKKSYPLFSLIGFFLMLFLSQALIFAKWTRYVVPTIPFIALIVASALTYLLHAPRIRRVATIGISMLFFCSFIYCVAFVITVYGEKDTRLQAVAYARKTIPANAPILSEVYDLGIVPFNQYFPDISLFNFYDLDNGAVVPVPHASYIILPSQRIYKSRILDTRHFPHGHTFYQDLFTGKNGYTKIYETPCDIFCQITYLGNPVFSFEETASVFDRPTLFIFKAI